MNYELKVILNSSLLTPYYFKQIQSPCTCAIALPENG